MTGGCPVCGAAHTSCGPTLPVTPVDILAAPTRKAYTMADLQEYKYVSNGVELTAMLDEHDAAQLGAVLVAAAPVTSGAADVKGRVDVHTAARGAPNKGR